MVVFALTLIRHGETSHNKDNVIQGQLDVPLSQAGIRQAELLGSHLQYQQYSHVYVSDLSRAMQTAERIVRQNKTFKASMMHDRRLRERKFGTVEGKSFKYLKEAEEKSNQMCGQYTPPGGETIQQVHDRAVSFFYDICEMVKEQSKEVSNDTAGYKINVNGSTSVDCGKFMGHKRKWENGEVNNPAHFDNQSRCNNKICIKELSAIKSSETEKDEFLLHEDKGSAVEKVSNSNDVNSESLHLDRGKEPLVGNGSSIDANENNGKYINSAKTDLMQNGCSAKKSDHMEKGNFSVMFTDEDIRSQIMSNTSDLPNIECPNVSLSPLVDQNFITSPIFSHFSQENAHGIRQERRLSVCSSCDDADIGPTLIANILVVSHGGWLRELLRHFVEDLECSVPGGRKQALRISPNAGLSKFTVSLEDHDGHPKIICLQIHDKQHLLTNSPDKVLKIDDIAL